MFLGHLVRIVVKKKKKLQNHLTNHFTEQQKAPNVVRLEDQALRPGSPEGRRMKPKGRKNNGLCLRKCEQILSQNLVNLSCQLNVFSCFFLFFCISFYLCFFRPFSSVLHGNGLSQENRWCLAADPGSLGFLATGGT